MAPDRVKVAPNGETTFLQQQLPGFHILFNVHAQWLVLHLQSPAATLHFIIRLQHNNSELQEG